MNVYLPIAQYPQSRTEIVVVRLSQWSVFALTYWKLIVMELIAKNSPSVVHNFWESDKEQARMGVVCLRTEPINTQMCLFVARSKMYQGHAPLKSEVTLSEICTRRR